MQSKNTESQPTRLKRKPFQGLSFRKDKAVTEAENRRDAAKAYGLSASQRNRKTVERKSKENQSSGTLSPYRERNTSSSIGLKSPVIDRPKDSKTHNEKDSRVEAWLSDAPASTPIYNTFGSDVRVDDGKKANIDSLSPSVDKSTQTDIQYESNLILTPHLECPISASEIGGSVPVKERGLSAGSAYDRSSTNSCKEAECEVPLKFEESSVLARIEELRKIKDALLAEKRIIQLKIEELKLRQEVRTLMRNVSKARDQLKSLASNEDSSPIILQNNISELVQPEDRMKRTNSPPKPTEKDTSGDNELQKTDGGALRFFAKTGSDTVNESKSRVQQDGNNANSANTQVTIQEGDRQQVGATEKYFQREGKEAVKDNDLQEIKEYFSRNANLRSAPAVLLGSLQNEDTQSFIKASSYGGVEMLSVFDIDVEDLQHKAFDETIKRLAGGRLDVMEGDHDDFNNEESSGESDIVSVSLDDEDEYTTMLDSIPLNTTTPEAIPQDNQEEDMFIEQETFEAEEMSGNDATRIHLPVAPVFPQAEDLQEMNAADSSAIVVFCSPRNGRNSPRSPRRLSWDTDALRNVFPVEMDPSGSDPMQNSRLTPPIPDTLITASSCSSCWVQFSRTDSEYVQDLVARFLKAFCEPSVPVILSANALPIPLRCFIAVQREHPSSQVQEAFDRAIFDVVNHRLIEIYDCIGRLQVDGNTSIGSSMWECPTYDSLLEGVLKTVFSTTDCDADPLSTYTDKEKIIEKMLENDARNIQAPHPIKSFKTQPFGLHH